MPTSGNAKVSIPYLTTTGIARRLRLREESGSTWLVIIADEAKTPRQEFKRELESLLLENILGIDLEEGNPLTVGDLLQNSPSTTAILYGFENWESTQWADLDLARSAMERVGANLLWMNEESAGLLVQFAPNIKSFVGSAFFSVIADSAEISDDERNSRLSELRDHFGQSDESIIRLAERGELPASPSYAEWLVLLGRGDLL